LFDEDNIFYRSKSKTKPTSSLFDEDNIFYCSNGVDFLAVLLVLVNKSPSSSSSNNELVGLALDLLQ
jgi:hypothetical protein